jgi:hypothetical protein
MAEQLSLPSCGDDRHGSPAGRSREPVKALVGGELAPCDACGEVPLERILYARIVDGRAILKCRSCGGSKR